MNYRFLLVQISWGDYRQTLSLKNIARVDSHKLKVTAETQTALSRLIELLLTNLNIVTLLLAHFSKPLASCSSLDNETDAWTMRHFLFIPACTVHDCSLMKHLDEKIIKETMIVSLYKVNYIILYHSYITHISSRPTGQKASCGRVIGTF